MFITAVGIDEDKMVPAGNHAKNIL